MSDTEEPAEPPTADGVPFLGSLTDVLGRPFEFRRECAEQYDGLVRVEAGPTELLLLTDPATVEEVFVSKADAFRKPTLMRERLGAAFGDGLLLSDGELWRDQRDRIGRAFGPDRIADYVERTAAVTERVVDGWDGGVYDAETQMLRITVPSLMDALFRTESVSYFDRIAEGAEALTMKYKPTNPSFYVPNWVPTPTNRRYSRGLDALEGVVDDLVAERRGPGGPDDPDDLLSILLAAVDDPETRVDRELLRDELLTMMTGGTGPPAFALAYALVLLADHPAEWAKLQREADEVLDGEPATLSDLPALSRTERAYKEAIRLHPPVWTLGREPTRDVTVGGYHVPAGTPVNATPWVAHRDKRYWDDPETFDPDRWTRDRDRPQFAYFPFGGGPRVCVGQRFALAESKQVLAYVAANYDLAPGTDEPLEHLVSTHMSPENAYVEVTPRDD